MPDLRNADGDELLQCTVSYPLADGTAETDIRAALDTCADLRPATATHWNWIRREKRAAASAARTRPSKSLTIETTRDDGALVLGSVELDGRALVLSVNSLERSERGSELLSTILGARIGQPLVVTETVEQMWASRNADARQQADLSEQERKMMENRTAKSDGAMASYSFDWMWTELGIADLRR